MNNISTKGYFVKRLKDSGFETWTMFDKYTESDPRKFTLLIDPSGDAVWCTCLVNLEEEGDVVFELDDGGRNVPRHFQIKTSSFDIIEKYLDNFNITRKYERKR